MRARCAMCAHGGQPPARPARAGGTSGVRTTVRDVCARVLASGRYARRAFTIAGWSRRGKSSFHKTKLPEYSALLPAIVPKIRPTNDKVCISLEKFHAIPVVAEFRTARSVSSMSSCTVPEKSVRSGLEYADRFACPDQLWALTRSRIGNNTQTLPSVQVVTACDGQLSSRRSTQLVVVNAACDLKQLTT
ncbi:hypothetical protein F511_27278 [Dorcoceras hygrometricum]|uniref:Uncharacterized protein n=1 Tax=Dorcoceras hygrometricum TaxID=472368 RepID=A0A2Z7CAL3_9LAMI|nr:hypothetical protein F511_27278 [Dorcoceras hygrometricum]